MSHVLLIQSPDAVGLVHRVTDVLSSHDLNIIANDEFVDPETARFFMRTEFTGAVEPKEILDEIRSRISEKVDGAEVRIAPNTPKRIVIFAGKEPHCLGDLLMRHCNGELLAKIEAVISNHFELASLARRFDIPFHHIEVKSEDRLAHEETIQSVLQSYRPQYLVLAKYMRVLSPDFVNAYPNRILNIHHSFLPAFIGAQPYRQAYNRGVKIIGATAHFVTELLDDGPIIAQSVIPVTHAHTAKSMAHEGREIEKIVLARALSLVLEERVFVCGRKTIIFE